MVARFGLGAASLVVEIASNDGYLLQYFVAQGVPVLGIEPAANVAAVAREEGRPHAGEVLRHARPPPSSRPQGRKADLIARQQRARARARPQRLRRAA